MTPEARAAQVVLELKRLGDITPMQEDIATTKIALAIRAAIADERPDDEKENDRIHTENMRREIHAAIVDDLRKNLGRDPTEQEIEAKYEWIRGEGVRVEKPEAPWIQTTNTGAIRVQFRVNGKEQWTPGVYVVRAKGSGDRIFIADCSGGELYFFGTDQCGAVAHYEPIRKLDIQAMAKETR